MIAWLAPTLALLGVLATAYFTRSRENEKARRDKLSQVYAKYLEVSAVSSAPPLMAIQAKRLAGQPLTDGETDLANKVMADFLNSHANIVVYGSPEVVAALSHFYDTVAEQRGQFTPAVNTAMIALITAMRHDSDAADYPGFAAHADNIVGAKAQMRAAGFPQTASSGTTE